MKHQLSLCLEVEEVPFIEIKPYYEVSNIAENKVNWHHIGLKIEFGIDGSICLSFSKITKFLGSNLVKKSY